MKRIVQIEVRLTLGEEKPAKLVKVKSHIRVINGKSIKVRSHWRRVLGVSMR